MSARPDYSDIREQVARLCADFPGSYWREKDRARAYPTEFVDALTTSGFLSVLIPEVSGRAGLPLSGARPLSHTSPVDHLRR